MDNQNNVNSNVSSVESSVNNEVLTQNPTQETQNASDLSQMQVNYSSINNLQSNEINDNQSQAGEINNNEIQANESDNAQHLQGMQENDSNQPLDSQKVVIEEQNKQELEESRLQKIKQSPYFKKLNETFEKLNQVKHIKIDSVFENIKDAHTIFSIEQRTYDFVINLNKILIVVVIVQSLLIMSLFPLKEKEPYLVGFSNATQNFVHIEPANKRIAANEALIRSLVGAYILNRETINRFDDTQRYEVVRLQSSMKVWKIFETIVSQEKSVYGNENLERNVRIVNITKIKNGYINAEIQVALFNLGRLQSQKRYRISLMYQFNDLEIDFKSLPKNPTGFQVTEYSVTEIATIKELDEENKVNPNSVTSKIKQKEINKKDGLDSNEFLRDNYQYENSNSSVYDEPIKNPMEFKTQPKSEMDSVYSQSAQNRKKLNQDIEKLQEMEAQFLQEQKKQQQNQKKEESKNNTQGNNSKGAQNSAMPNPFE